MLDLSENFGPEDLASANARATKAHNYGNMVEDHFMKSTSPISLLGAQLNGP